jgi:hypothetical protein
MYYTRPNYYFFLKKHQNLRMITTISFMFMVRKI